MAFLSALHNLVHHLSRTRRRSRPPSRKRAATFRPWLELLEDRAVPVTITWTGAADGTNWQTAGNWDLGRVPGAVANDDVVIPDVTATSLITYSTGSTALRSLTSQEAVVLSGGSLSIGASGATFQSNFTVSGGTLTFDSMTVDGSGTLTIAGTLTLTRSTVKVPLVNQGMLVVQGTSALTGSLTTAVGSTLRVLASGTATAALTVANGFTNNGAIELTSVDVSRAATLTVSSGTLTNAAGASLSALAGTGVPVLLTPSSTTRAASASPRT